MDYAFVAASIPLFIKAAELTLVLAFWGISLSLAVGLACALVLYYRIRVFDKITVVYIELSRNTPLLIQLFFLYYGFAKIGIKFEADTCAVFGLAFLGGSYIGGSLSRRPGSGDEIADRIRAEPRAYANPAHALYHLAAGFCRCRAGDWRQCHIFIKGNIRCIGHRAGGSDVCR